MRNGNTCGLRLFVFVTTADCVQLLCGALNAFNGTANEVNNELREVSEDMNDSWLMSNTSNYTIV